MTLWQKIEFTAICAVLSCATGCASGGFSPAKQAQYDRVRCEVAALEPLALSDADAIVHALEDGRLGLDDVFALVEVGKANVTAVKAAFQDCRAQFPKLN